MKATSRKTLAEVKRDSIERKKLVDRLETLAEVKRELIEDSIERKKLVDRLVELVRIDEREKTLATLGNARALAEREGR